MSAWLSHAERLTHAAWNMPVERVRRLDARAVGWLQVGTAPVWLTLDGQVDDWVLMPGERLPLKRGERAVVEPWHAGSVAQLSWQAAPGPAQRVGLGLTAARRGVAALRGALAAGLRALAAAFAAWARNAEAMARRAQGCMDAGESTASSGAVQ